MSRTEPAACAGPFRSIDWDDLPEPPRRRRFLWLAAGVLVILAGFALGTALRYALPAPAPTQQEAPPQ